MMRITAAQLAKNLIGNDTDALVQPLAEHTNSANQRNSKTINMR